MKRFFDCFLLSIVCVLALVLCFDKRAFCATVLETDVATASEGCTMLGVYGSYYSQPQDALNRINEIRKEACDAGNVPDPRNSSRMLTSSDYVPIKWSTDLESIARIRACEGGLAFSFIGTGHARLNGMDVFSVTYNGVCASAENLAYNWGTSMVDGINQWYEEKADWVNQVSGAVTGHYTSMIDPSNTYVGLGDFYTEEAQYHNVLAGMFCHSSKELNQTMQDAPTNVMQKIEVKNSYITGYILDGTVEIYTERSTTLEPRVNIQNGSNTHKLWVLGSVEYASSDVSVATVTSAGVVTGLKNGTATITAKTENGILATAVVTVKCDHDKKIVSEKASTCVAEGERIYNCDFCGDAFSEKIPKKAHDYVYGAADSEGYRVGVCSVCEDTIKIIPPTTYKLWWRNSTSDSGYYHSTIPSSNPVGSTIYCWIDDVDGDSKYQDMVIESSDETVVSVSQKVVANSANNQLKVLGPGTTTITIYPWYNARLKTTVKVVIGEDGAKDDNLNEKTKKYLDVGEKFKIKGTTYKVMQSNSKKKRFEVSCIKIGSKNITEYKIPNKVSYDGVSYKVVNVGKNTFSGCNKLKKLSLGSNITTIDDKAFYKCSKLTKITLPSKVTRIGKQAFAGCKKLKLVTIKSSKLKASKIGKNAFKGIKAKATIKVPEKRYREYKKMLKKKGIGDKATFKKI